MLSLNRGVAVLLFLLSAFLLVLPTLVTPAGPAGDVRTAQVSAVLAAILCFIVARHEWRSAPARRR